jgi:hypothetical protein
MLGSSEGAEIVLAIQMTEVLAIHSAVMPRERKREGRPRIDGNSTAS